MSALNGRGQDSPNVQQLIIQMSAVEDRGPQEEAVATEGFIPLVVFANGPENAFLVRTTVEILDAALDAAHERLDEGTASRLTFRSTLYSAMRTSIEQDFSAEEAMDAFPSLALQLFAEALAQHGVEHAGDIPPCAVRFAPDNLHEPDFETAEDGGME